MAKQWKNVRLPLATYQKLMLVHSMMVESHVKGRIELESDNRDRFAVSQAVERMCEEYLDHRRRGAKKA